MSLQPQFLDPRLIDASDGVRLAIFDRPGHGTGPTVLFAHATGFCAAVWGPMATSVSAGRHLALDFRSHGRSSDPIDGDLAWEGVARDVRSCLTASDVTGPVVGVGHSMGGAALLLTEAAHPGTFSSIWAYEPIVIDPAHRSAHDNGGVLSAGAARRRPSFPDRETARSNFASKPPLSDFAAASLEAYLDGGFMTSDDGSLHLLCRRESEARFYEMGAVHRGWDQLPEITCPARIVRGNADLPGPAWFGPAVAQRLPHGELGQFDHLGHMGPMQAPAELAADLNSWLAR